MKAFGERKFCPKCRRMLDVRTDFGKDSARQDGLHPHCKLCRRGYRLLRKPIPERQIVVGSNWPTRHSISSTYWEEFDTLVECGVPVTIVKPDGGRVDWSDLT